VEIAVLGGGITGLCSAFQLSKKLPNVHITLYEKTSRLGGWIDSDRVEVDGGTIVFEHGPHTLRAGNVAGLLPLRLVISVNLNMLRGLT
jgi:protoporphyrinogen/coproporphyrinogen III oxidase